MQNLNFPIEVFHKLSKSSSASSSIGSSFSPIVCDFAISVVVVAVSVSDRVIALATAETTFSAGIMAARSSCSETVSTVAVIIWKTRCFY